MGLIKASILVAGHMGRRSNVFPDERTGVSVEILILPHHLTHYTPPPNQKEGPRQNFRQSLFFRSRKRVHSSFTPSHQCANKIDDFLCAHQNRLVIDDHFLMRQFQRNFVPTSRVRSKILGAHLRR